MRKTVGFVISGLQDDFTRRICHGVMRAAQRRDINIVIIPGKYIDRPIDNPVLRYEYQYNNLFSSITKDNIDGLVIAANCVCCYCGTSEISEVLSRYDGIPTVLAATYHEGFLSVNFDNKPGIIEGMSYMIEQLSMTRIGLISAALGTSDSDERKLAYEESMRNHSLEIESRFYADINHDYANLDEVRRFLDDNPDIQGVVCENDSVARILYSVMDERGLVPGKDISVLGFDNIEWAANVFPGLSTVIADASVLGERSLDLLADLFDGKGCESQLVPTSFIKRESIANAINDSGINKDEIDYEDLFKSVFYKAINTNDSVLTSRIHDRYFASINDVSKYIACEKDSMSDAILDELYCAESLQYVDIGRYTIFIKKVREYYETKSLSSEQRKRIYEMESTINIKLLRAINHFIEDQKIEQNDLVFSMKKFISDTVEFSDCEDTSYATMLQDLDWLWINYAVVYMLNEPVVLNTAKEFVMPSHLLVKAKKLKDYRKAVDFDKQYIPISEMFRNKMLENDSRFATVLLPLYFNEVFYGFFWCDITDKLFSEGDFIAAQLGSATRTIDLLRKFDNMSKVDRLTGLLNRRGFDSEAGILFEKLKESKSEFIVMYIDMNNLKIINDKFGHENGDFALASIGHVLDVFFKGRGVVGRIGGDEYAVVASIRPNTSTGDFEDMLYKEFDAFNEECDKPYYVTVSIGSYTYGVSENITLDEALKRADEIMYEAKKNKKSVLKSSVQ